MGLYKLDVSRINDFDIEDIRKNSEEITFDGLNRRLPEGVFVTDGPIYIENGDFRGAGSDKTLIIADFPEKDNPIMFIGSTPYVEGFTICYRDGLVTGEESECERVGIYTTKYWPLSKGACIRDVSIKNVGTGIFSDRRRIALCVAFSVFFDNISITDFSYRGFNFIAPVRTGNVYSNIKISSGKYICDSAFYFSYATSNEEESETDIVSLKVYDTRANQPIVFGGARALVANEITLQNVETLSGDFIIWDKSSGKIRNLTISDSTISDKGNLFKVGDTKFISFDTLNYICIEKLNLNNISGTGKEFNLFCRREEQEVPCSIKVDDYKFTSETAASVLDEFPTKGLFTFIKKGNELKPSRLCPYYSKMINNLGETLVWNGSEWQ